MSSRPRKAPSTDKKMLLRSEALPLSAIRAQQLDLLCHCCHVQSPSKANYLLCANYPECKCAFCFSCLKSLFAIVPTKPRFDSWVCLVCRGLCNCRPCREKLRQDLNKINTESTASPVPTQSNTLLVEEWRTEPYLSTERAFKGPKVYSLKRKTPTQSPPGTPERSAEENDPESGSDYRPNSPQSNQSRSKKAKKKPTSRQESGSSTSMRARKDSAFSENLNRRSSFVPSTLRTMTRTRTNTIPVNEPRPVEPPMPVPEIINSQHTQPAGEFYKSVPQLYPMMQGAAPQMYSSYAYPDPAMSGMQGFPMMDYRLVVGSPAQYVDPYLMQPMGGANPMEMYGMYGIGNGMWPPTGMGQYPPPMSMVPPQSYMMGGREIPTYMVGRITNEGRGDSRNPTGAIQYRPS